MAFIRFKGPYAYLVENCRTKGEKKQVRQRVLFYFGKEVIIDERVVAEVTRRFPDARVDWDALRRAHDRHRPTQQPEDDWLASD